MNGTLATTDSDFASWQLSDVALLGGTNFIDVVVEDNDGNLDAFDLTVEQVEDPGPMLISPRSFAFDANNGLPRLLVPDWTLDALVIVELTEGATKGRRTILSDDDTGSGDIFSQASGVALDVGNNRALVVDPTFFTSSGKVFGVDLTTGDREVLADGLVSPSAIAFDSVNNRALVSSSAPKTYLLDLSTSPAGVSELPGPSAPRSIAFNPQDLNKALIISTVVSVEALFELDISAETLTELDTFENPQSVAFFPGEGDRVVVGDAPDALYEVDLTDFSRTLLSGVEPDSSERLGLGPKFTSQFVFSAVFDSADNNTLFVLSDDIDRIYEVNLTTSDRAPLEVSLGDGPELNMPTHIALLPDEDFGLATTALVVDFSASNEPYFYAVNLVPSDEFGDRRVLSGFDADNPNTLVGSGVELSDVEDMFVDVANNRVLVVDSDLDALVSIDIDTGARTVLSDDDTGSGDVMSPVSLDIDTATNTAYIVDNSGAVLSADLDTGDRIVISDDTIGSGPTIEYSGIIRLDSDTRRAWVVISEEEEYAQLYRLNLDTGERILVSDSSTGEGIDVFEAQSLSLDLDNNRAFVTGYYTDGVVAYDLTTGDRTMLSGIDDADQLFGGGSAFNVSSKLAGSVYDDDTQTLLVTDQVTGSLIAIDTESGDRVLVSGFNF